MQIMIIMIFPIMKIVLFIMNMILINSSDKGTMFIAAPSGLITSQKISLIPSLESAPLSPLSKLLRLAEPSEERALEMIADIERLETQLSLAMYLKFGGLCITQITIR